MTRSSAPPDRAAAWRNWAGNVSDSASLSTPDSLDALAELVVGAAAAGRRVRVAGSGHSFSPIASSPGVRVSLARMPDDVVVDGASVTVPAGMTLRALNLALAAHGLALPNLGDIDAQTVAGALQTGTHGTGARYGCLSTFVSGLTMMTADGSVLNLSRSAVPGSAVPGSAVPGSAVPGSLVSGSAAPAPPASLLPAAAVGLGALGVITSVTLSCVPAFVLRAVERPDSLDSMLSSVDSLIEEHDHAEFYWYPYTSRVQVKINDRVPVSDAPLPRWRGWLDDSFLSNTVFGAGCRVARVWPGFARPLMHVSARALTARTYTAASHEVFCTPRRVRFVEMEYGLPRAALWEALGALRSIVDSLPFRVAFPVEVRFVAADDLWLSHGYGRDSVYIAIHQYVGMPYEPYFRAFERVCLGLGGRPHWGKMHFASAAELREAYPRWDDWARVRAQLDPDGVFGSPWLDDLFPPSR